MPTRSRVALVDDEDRHARGREAGHRPDREVDLAEQEHQHDPQGDHADGAANSVMFTRLRDDRNVGSLA